jgi:glycosyltransferase involved in cell wall biosynthesis
MLKFGKEKDIKVVCDISEWYSFRQFSGIAGKIDYFIFQYAFRNVFYKCDKIICSSSLISRYFSKKNQNVLILNGIMDVSEYRPKFDLRNEKCIMVYAGSPGRKDYLIQFLRAFEFLDDGIKQKIDLKIIGLTERDVSRLNKKTESSRYGHIELTPRIPREELIDILRNASFSLLLRPNLRYANAGFPSKLCESAALGTPMITNLTSDMGRYLSKENAIIIKDISPESVAEAMKKAADMDQESYLRLRHGAYDIAENYFDISVCSEKLKAFLVKG